MNHHVTFIEASEAVANFAVLLSDVERDGREFAITHDGVEVARLVASDGEILFKNTKISEREENFGAHLTMSMPWDVAAFDHPLSPAEANKVNREWDALRDRNSLGGVSWKELRDDGRRF